MGASVKPPHRRSWAIAYGSMVAALSVVLLFLASVIPVLLFIGPALSSLMIESVRREFGTRLALADYIAVSLLGLLFVPDKEVVLVFAVLLGYYPLLKPKLDAVRLPVVRVALKLLLCNAAAAAAAAVLLVFFPAEGMAEAFQKTALLLTGLTLVLCNISFLLFDRALVRLMLIYELIWKPRLYKRLRH